MVIRSLDGCTCCARSAFTHLGFWRKLFDCSATHWKDNIKEWTGQSTPSLLRVAEDRHRWAAATAEASVDCRCPQRRLGVRGFDWWIDGSIVHGITSSEQGKCVVKRVIKRQLKLSSISNRLAAMWKGVFRPPPSLEAIYEQFNFMEIGDIVKIRRSHFVTIVKTHRHENFLIHNMLNICELKWPNLLFLSSQYCY